MAEEQNNIQQTSEGKVALFNKQMVKDMDATLMSGAFWTGAVNAVNHSHGGDMGVLGNEPANRFVAEVPYDLIGAIPLTGDKWVLFSTDDVSSEIGVFDDSEGVYRMTVNSGLLGFKRTNLITGAAKRNYDCTYSVYWADGLNPDRMLNLDRVPYKEKERKRQNSNNKILNSNGARKNGCVVKEYTDELDVEALRLTRLVKSPSLRLWKSYAGGNLLNGSYQAVIAYAVNGIRVSDYFPPSNVQGIFDHGNVSGALELEVVECDEDFDEFELVMISSVNQTTAARRVGIYSTRQRMIMIDMISESSPAVPLDWIPIQTPAYDRSDAIYDVNNYLLRTGVYTKPDFNWQPLVNKIQTKWVMVEVPANYYVKGGNVVGYMRDEVYAFFIRAVYNTGERSACYQIPGRKGEGAELSVASGQDVFEMQLKEKPKVLLKQWQVENSAKATGVANREAGLLQVEGIDETSLLNGEAKIIGEGIMGYWESTELYPDDQPGIWGELCGQPIRHHKMPDVEVAPIFSQEGRRIVLLGVRFDNIAHPVDINGQKIDAIVGYEILRASREGNRTVIAKGLLNNVGAYDLPEEISDKKGLYPNFPYNDVRPNVFLSSGEVKGGCTGKGFKPLTEFKKDVFTFHSPETQFKNPFLSATELKVHGLMTGTVTGQFDPVYKHPKHKLIRDLALIVAGLVGVGAGLLAIRGKRTTVKMEPKSFNLGLAGTTTSVPSGGPTVTGYYTAIQVIDLLTNVTGLDATAVGSMIDSLKTKMNPAASTIGSAPGVMGGGLEKHQEESAVSNLPLPLRIAGGAFLFTYFFSQGTEEALRVIRNLVPYQQYAYQYNSHGFYNGFQKVGLGNRRRYINDSVYLEPYLQEFAGKYRVNNLYRGRQVLLEAHRELEFPGVQDNSRTTIGELKQWDDPSRGFSRITSAYYASLKVPLAAQYGQLESCVLLPVSTGVHYLSTDTQNVSTDVYSSPVLFGGDVYVNRFTEKNSFPLFHEWMYDMHDGTEWDYTQYPMLPYPRFWMNSTQYELTNLMSSLIRFNFKDNVLPNDFAALDRKTSDCKKKVSFVINKAYFYLFVNGVRDFFCESEMNMAYRDWDDRDAQRHYDPNGFTDLKALFRSDIIKSGNHFKYDLSLSVSRLMHNFISWGQVLPRDFDPAIAVKCYQYYPKRIIYSLPQQEELKKDNWTAFLANNYKDFGSRVTAIHSVGQSGAMIFFEDRSPVMFQGVDQLQTDAGVKITIGDGGLFQQPLSAVSNADANYEFGACRSRLGVINTPGGLFWISQEQGKVFSFGGGMNNIANQGMKFWFNQYLPSQLLKDFPGFTLVDNAVVGIGCMAVYDSMNDLVYFIKRDYKLRDDYKGKLIYDKDNVFLLRGRTRVYLGDATYFEDASWTISYDVKTQAWVSFHDWRPDGVLPSRSHFLTVKGGEIWKHNDRCDRFCNFYGKDYPFEVEFPVSTGQEVMTLRNLEYMLECYVYYDNCEDRHHVLDFNFDRAMVFNSEQHSGMLRLLPKPKNNPYLMLEAPVMNVNAVDTYYSKEENKYRINQFFDLTRNRSEFNDQYIPMWDHSADGYHKQIHGGYVTYSKGPLQRKKFRHYTNRVILRRVKCGDVKMLLKMVGSKHLRSMR